MVGGVCVTDSALITEGWELACEWHDRLDRWCHRPFVREKLWDATVDALLACLTAFDGRGRFGAFFVIEARRRRAKVWRNMGRMKRDASRERSWGNRDMQDRRPDGSGQVDAADTAAVLIARLPAGKRAAVRWWMTGAGQTKTGRAQVCKAFKMLRKAV